MDEITNSNITWNTTTSTSDNTTLTFSTDGSDSVWFPYYKESTWLPYEYEKYYPKWHVMLGYKNQMKKMWNR